MKLVLIFSLVFLLPFTASCQLELSHDTNTTFVEWKNKRKASKVSLDTNYTHLEALSEMKLFPNPSQGLFQLELSLESKYRRIEVRNLNGQLIRSAHLKRSRRQSFDFSELESGVYFISLMGEGKRETQRVMIR